MLTQLINQIIVHPKIAAKKQTADRAARAAGTVYRVVAGTESLTTDQNNNNNKNKNDEGRLSPTTSYTSSSSSHSAVI